MAKRLNLQVESDDNVIKQKNQVPSPDFLTKELLCAYMQKGLAIDDAAKLCGISAYMLSVYRSDPEFEDYVQECSVRCEDSNLENIKDAGDAGIWNASAWILERRFPDKYAKKDTVRHEYDIKLDTVIKVIFKAVNALEPLIRQSFLQKLRELDVDGEIIQIQQIKKLEYEPEEKKGQAII
jgi:hypothetical protein